MVPPEPTFVDRDSLDVQARVTTASDARPGLADPPDSERRLVEALRAGDPRATESFVREHGPRMLAVARRILGNREEIRDVVQDAFLAALRSLDGFRGDARLSTWLHRIVVNAALTRMRGEGRHPPEVELDPLTARFDDLGAHARPVGPLPFGPEAALAGTEIRRRVRACIARLPAAYRTILVLRDIEELDADETARLLAISRNAVNIRLHRARQALMHMLQED